MSENNKLVIIKEKITAFINRKESTDLIGNKAGDEDVYDDTYGITLHGRNIIAYVITAFIAAAIISGSFILAVYLPGDSELINSRADELLQNDEEYTSLIEQKESLEAEVNKLNTDSEEKKAQIESLNDYDNTMAELDMKIKEKREEINSLNNEKKQKQSRLDEINADISTRNGTEITLTPGIYTVGTNLQVGKYSVTGSGKFQVASSDGVSKVNITLGESPYIITLEQGDKVKTGSSTKFTPVD